MTACQVRTCIENTKDVADTFNKFKHEYDNEKNAKKYTTNTYKDMLPVRVTSLEGEYNGIVNQFVVLKRETDETVESLKAELRKMRLCFAGMGLFILVFAIAICMVVK